MRSLFAYESVFREGKKANRIWHYLRGAKYSSCAVRRLGKADVCMCVCLCVCTCVQYAYIYAESDGSAMNSE